MKKEIMIVIGMGVTAVAGTITTGIIMMNRLNKNNEEWREIVIKIENELKEKLSDKDISVKELSETITRKEKVIRNRNEKIKQLEEDFRDINHELEEDLELKHSTIGSLEKEVKKLEDELDDSMKIILERNNEIKELKDSIEETKNIKNNEGDK